LRSNAEWSVFAGNDELSLQVALALDCKGETSLCAGVKGAKSPLEKKAYEQEINIITKRAFSFNKLLNENALFK